MTASELPTLQCPINLCGYSIKVSPFLLWKCHKSRALSVFPDMVFLVPSLTWKRAGLQLVCIERRKELGTHGGKSRENEDLMEPKAGAREENLNAHHPKIGWWSVFRLIITFAEGTTFVVVCLFPSPSPQQPQGKPQISGLSPEVFGSAFPPHTLQPHWLCPRGASCTLSFAQGEGLTWAKNPQTLSQGLQRLRPLAQHCPAILTRGTSCC